MHVARSVCLAAVLFSAVAGAVRAQPTPPAQDFVVAVGNSPLRAPTTADFAPGASFTMEGWVYLTSHTPYAWLMGKGLTTSGADPFLSFALMLSADGTKLMLATSTGAPGTYRELTGPAALPLRTWTHVAAVLDAGTTRLLINGQVVASATAAGAPLALPDVPFSVGIAYRPDGGTNYPAFPGYARQLRFWTNARSAAQIASAMGQALPSDRSGLVAAWPMDESGGAIARDLSGNNRALIAGAGAIQSARLSVLEAGPFYATTTTGVADGSLSYLSDGELIDFDSDGDLDLVLYQVFSPPTVPETRTRLRAFRNNNGTFIDVTDGVLGNVTMVHPRHYFVGDFNGDGRADLLLVGHGTDTPPFPGEQSVLLLQTADGRLADATARLPQRSSFTHNVAAADIDGDGDLDVYMANVFGGQVGPEIYLNDGSGNFTVASNRLPADIATRAGGRVFTASLLVDVNRDGRPDLVLGGENDAPNELLMNNGSGTFVRDPRFTLPAKVGGSNWSTVALASGDFNGDGAADVVLGTTGGSETLADGRTINGYGIAGLQLLLNRGDGTFYDATADSGIAWTTAERWVVWARATDLDGDGRVDLLAQVRTHTGTSLRLFLNRGAARFVDVTDAFRPNYTTMLVHSGDFDRDGRTDLLVANSTGVTVARSIKTLDRRLFQSGVDDPGRMTNLSVRTKAGTGDETLIAGFALGGGGGTKQLLVRAIGPTLGAFGLTDTLADPLVEIAPLGSANVATNDNWGGTAQLKAAFGAVGAFPLANEQSADAALLFAPGAGAYTAKVTGANNGTGLALVEVYDSGTGNAPRLTNVSARTNVGIGSDVLIVGFVVSGNVPKKLLIRAVGPTLGAFGLTGTLVDPVLDLRPLGSENIVATNDDWRGTAALKSAFTSVGAFQLVAGDNSKDAAIAIELPPGAYTATVSGKSNTTGVALVEVYELP